MDRVPWCASLVPGRKRDGRRPRLLTRLWRLGRTDQYDGRRAQEGKRKADPGPRADRESSVVVDLDCRLGRREIFVAKRHGLILHDHLLLQVWRLRPSL